MKQLILAILSITLTLASFAQSNSIRVQSIESPNDKTIYAANDSAEMRVIILNEGPADLSSGDAFRVTYNLANNSGQGTDFDTTINVGNTPLNAGNAREYVVNSNLNFAGADVYSVCADVARGTTFFPNNTSKTPGKCIIFTVNIEENKLKLDKSYYANGTIFFELNQASDLTVQVFDITGKNLLSKQLSNVKQHELAFDGVANGFYFLKTTDARGKSVTSKFVVR